MSKFSVILLFACVALAGIAFIPLLPVKLEPSRTLPQLSVSYSMPNHSARMIEMEVTSRLEAMLARIRGIREIRSTSGDGWGKITLEPDKHTLTDAARFEASTIIRQTWPDLPEGLTYPILEMSRPDDKESRPFISYTLNAASAPVLIQRFAENHIKPGLAGIPGIYRVDITGATPMEWQLEYDSRQLAALGVTPEDIRHAIALDYSKKFLGLAQADEGGEWIRLVLAPGIRSEGFDPSFITVTAADSSLIRLDRLVKVTRREEEPTGYYRINGLNSIYLSLHADESANQLELAGKVKEEMKAIRSLLPAGYEMHVSYDATQFIREELSKIHIRTGMTIVILLLFVLLMTRNVRYLALIASGLAINICIAIIFYYLLGLEMQLYSLAGVTLSLSLIIDNTIVMSDHIRKRHNRDAFLPILTATLTTIGALSIIFFFDEKIRLNLQDFAAVVIINLAVSLVVALFFIPALQPLPASPKERKQPEKRRMRMQRGAVVFGRAYLRLMHFLCRWKKSACLVLVLAFGLPVFMLPDKIEMKRNRIYSHRDSLFINSYNKLTANATIKPVLDKALGGSLRLFVQKVYEGSYFTRREETVLTVTASLPNGTTLAQMNRLIGRVEAYLGTYNRDIRQFQTRIFNARQARIDIFFTPAGERSGFPYTLKSRLISKVLELEGGWSVYGLQDQGFSNNVRENAGSYRIEMLGYNYDELYRRAEELRDTLLAYPRIREVIINYEFSWWKDDYKEFFFNPDKKRLAEEGIRPSELFAAIYPVFGKNIYAGNIVVDNEIEHLKLTSRQSGEYDVWSMLYAPQPSGNAHPPYKLSGLAFVEKESAPQNIAKINQQYRLCLQYEYIGARQQGGRIQERTLETFNASLPMGYSAKSENYDYNWTSKDNRQYLLLLLIIVIIYFTCSILFNSLRQPLAIIFVIPVSYIGVFLTFYGFGLNFDQGGFASFVLLSGITINAGIYLLNEYNKIRERKPLMSPYRAYLKAWNAKISPIFLTVISSVLGFLPFMAGAGKEAFWFPLAAGTIGGLLLSVAGIFLYLPIFIIPASVKNPC
jgi:multidrug efflux pump subunit AcrB